MAPRNSGGIPYVSTIFKLSMEISGLTWDGAAQPVSRDQILKHARGQGNINFPCSVDHEDWQSYPVDPYSAICDDHTVYKSYRASSVKCMNTAAADIYIYIFIMYLKHFLVRKQSYLDS